MFMDALTASTKKEPRKRKRRTSSSRDGPEAKKEATAGKEDDINKDSTPPLSPSNTGEDNKSPPIIRPLLKVSNAAKWVYVYVMVLSVVLESLL
jgi:protein phosphatase 1 regulatory subunit 10